jgi:hypothetical protein
MAGPAWTKARNAAEVVEGVERLIDNPSIHQEMATCARSCAEKLELGEVLP